MRLTTRSFALQGGRFRCGSATWNQRLIRCRTAGVLTTTTPPGLSRGSLTQARIHARSRVFAIKRSRVGGVSEVCVCPGCVRPLPIRRPHRRARHAPLRVGDHRVGGHRPLLGGRQCVVSAHFHSPVPIRCSCFGVIDPFGYMRVATLPVLTAAAGRGVTECPRWSDRRLRSRRANFLVGTSKSRSGIPTNPPTSPSKSEEERSERTAVSAAR